MKKETKICCMCGKEYTGYGNNAEPLAKGLCCDECNIKVITRRLRDYKPIDERLWRLSDSIALLIWELDVADIEIEDVQERYYDGGYTTDRNTQDRYELSEDVRKAIQDSIETLESLKDAIRNYTEYEDEE